MWMNDEELHEQIILLDEDAIREWQAGHSGLIVGWLAKRGIGVPDAEEIWNDVLSATVEAAPRLNPRGVSLRRYAFRVARNLAADRRERLQQEATDPLDEELAERPLRQSKPDPRRV